MTEFLWPLVALGCFCFGVTTGIAWAAQWRPGYVCINVKVANDE